MTHTSNNPQSAIHIPQSDASALIVVLWVIGLLSILVSSFTFDAHIEARITSYYRKRVKAEYLARSGIEIAKLLMIQSAEIKKNQAGMEEKEEEWWYKYAKHLSEGGALTDDRWRVTKELGEGKVTVEIVTELACRNINSLNLKNNSVAQPQDERDLVSNLERILEVGGIPEDMWPELIESFLDWIDLDSVARVDGAETEDYYATLEPPYHAKNGPLDTVEELLLVKGFNRTILFGGVIETEYEGEDPIRITGIRNLLTIYGSGKVNVNVAERDVLMTLPAVDEMIVGAIGEEREGLLNEDGEGEWAPFKSPEDFCSRMGLPLSIKDYIATDSAIYRITSVGMVHGVRREVWCIGEYANKKLTILKWLEQE